MKIKPRSRPKLKTAVPDRWYLAFGSNLCKSSMATRCPDAIPVGKKMLNNARLVFRGVADIQYEPGSKAPAGLWKISARDERALDNFEGVHCGMYRKKWIDIGQGRQALIYLMNDDGIHPPSRYYANVIREGYKDFGLDESYLDEAIAASFDKVPTEQTTRRRERQKQNPDQQELVQIPEIVAFEKIEALRKRLADRDELA